jgi:hypothetical protein
MSYRFSLCNYKGGLNPVIVHVAIYVSWCSHVPHCVAFWPITLTYRENGICRNSAFLSRGRPRFTDYHKYCACPLLRFSFIPSNMPNSQNQLVRHGHEFTDAKVAKIAVETLYCAFAYMTDPLH